MLLIAAFSVTGLSPAQAAQAPTPTVSAKASRFAYAVSQVTAMYRTPAALVGGQGLRVMQTSAKPTTVRRIKIIKGTTPTPTPTATPTTTPTTTPTPTTPPKARIGMSAPISAWDQRMAEVGPGIEARRIFYQLGDTLTLAQKTVDNGMYPILSFKIPGNDWAGVAQGKYDAQLATLKQRLVALNAPVFVTLHHEPAKDGTAADYAAMLTYALPRLNTPLVDVGPIANGWWWSSLNYGYNDAEIAEWLTPGVLQASEIIAADTYQGGTSTKPGEGGSVKMANMVKWAQRTNVDALGVAEFNAHTAAEITAATGALASSPLFKFGAVWNSECADCTHQPLVGDRLTAFKAALANWR